MFVDCIMHAKAMPAKALLVYCMMLAMAMNASNTMMTMMMTILCKRFLLNGNAFVSYYVHMLLVHLLRSYYDGQLPSPRPTLHAPHGVGGQAEASDVVATPKCAPPAPPRLSASVGEEAEATHPPRPWRNDLPPAPTNKLQERGRTRGKEADASHKQKRKRLARHARSLADNEAAEEKLEEYEAYVQKLADSITHWELHVRAYKQAMWHASCRLTTYRISCAMRNHTPCSTCTH